MARKLLGVMVLWVAVAPMAAMAEDINPAPWRGAEGTTFAQWEFLTPNPQPAPDWEVNPYGSAEMRVWPGIGQAWWAEWGDREGVWPLSGTIEVFIPNRPQPLPLKEIWLQLTWASQAPQTVPLISVNEWIETVETVQTIALGPTNEPPPAGDTWRHTTYKITIMPNPPFETLRIDGAIMVDEIVVDTRCVPEPGTWGLVAVALLALAGCAWRGRQTA